MFWEATGHMWDTTEGAASPLPGATFLPELSTPVCVKNAKTIARAVDKKVIKSDLQKMISKTQFSEISSVLFVIVFCIF